MGTIGMHGSRCVTVHAAPLIGVSHPRYDVLGEFMEYLARAPVVRQVPAALVAYLGVLTSLASGPVGAQVGPFAGMHLPHAFCMLGCCTMPSQACKSYMLRRAGHVPATEGGQLVREHLLALPLQRGAPVLRPLHTRRRPAGEGCCGGAICC